MWSTMRAMTASPFSMRAMTTFSEASRVLFGNAPVTNMRSSRKLLNKKLKGPKIVAWYPPTMESYKDKHYKSGEYERRQLKLEKLKRKGKGPPKKGSGKGAMKRKK
jgi:small subunit ribosomal protein S33